MREYTIYTCGKMSGLTLGEQMSWRIKTEKEIRAAAPDAYITFIHPPFYYNYEDTAYKSQAEVKKWELGIIKNVADIVVVNLDGINDSVGSHYELCAAEASNRNIFIIGIGDRENVHPWILDSCLRVEDDLYSAAEYIATYCLL